MEFCPECGKLLTPKDKKGNTILICSSCGFEKNPEGSYTKSEAVESQKEDIVVVEKNDENLPKTSITCPECSNNEAYYWIEQTRAADEAPTRFYKCTKCSHTWREYG